MQKYIVLLICFALCCMFGAAGVGLYYLTTLISLTASILFVVTLSVLVVYVWANY